MEVICWVIPLIFHRGLALRVWCTQLRRHCADSVADDSFSLITRKHYVLFPSSHERSLGTALKPSASHCALLQIFLCGKLSHNCSTHRTPLRSARGTSLSTCVPHTLERSSVWVLLSGDGTPVNCLEVVSYNSSVNQLRSTKAAMSLEPAWQKRITELITTTTVPANSH